MSNLFDSDDFIDDIDTQIANGINPFTGKSCKFPMDRFFGKGLLTPKMSQEDEEKWCQWWQEIMPERFKDRRKESEKEIQNSGRPSLRPQAFRDTEFMNRMIAAADTAEKKTLELEVWQKAVRKQRKRDFMEWIHLCLYTEGLRDGR